MAPPRKKNSSRTGAQQINTYSFVLGNTLRLVKQTKPAARESHFIKGSNEKTLAGGRRSTDKDDLYLYELWDSLSQREKQVAILARKELTNEQIALWTKLSVSTVKSYLQHVFFKLRVNSKIELRLKFGHINPEDHFSPRI